MPNHVFIRQQTVLMIIATAAILSLISASFASAQSRHALIIANTAYESALGSLSNSNANAEQIEAALKKHNFDVDLVTDTNIAALRRAVIRHALALRGEGHLGVIYYTGYGVYSADNSQNYLIPLDSTDHLITETSSAMADEISIEALASHSLPLDYIQWRLQEIAPEAAHLVLLDTAQPQQTANAAYQPLQATQEHWPGSLLAVFNHSEQTTSPFAKALTAELDIAAGESIEILLEAAQNRLAAQKLASSIAYRSHLNHTVTFGAAASAELKAPASPYKAPPWENERFVVRVQQALKRLGYDVGRIDGDYGRRTKLAFKAFLQDQGLPSAKGPSFKHLKAMRTASPRPVGEADIGRSIVQSYQSEPFTASRTPDWYTPRNQMPQRLIPSN